MLWARMFRWQALLIATTKNYTMGTKLLDNTVSKTPQPKTGYCSVCVFLG